MLDKSDYTGKNKADIEVYASGSDHGSAEQHRVSDDHRENVIEDSLARAYRTGQGHTVWAEPTQRLKRVDVDNVYLDSGERRDIIHSSVKDEYAYRDIY